ncbi:MAG: lipid IV(A) 3-deoxy-D-manno-octulosonic acid transferase [Gammaproteobacteria bacterium]|nr:lipid IV(A) 3-deoxy-D-manno-octulosonic acid transferase [Gammaproteobacteria bacterium]
MRILYSLVLYLCAPLALCYLLLRGTKNRAYLERIPERFGYIREPGSAQPVIWVHAVSVGEVQASVTLVKRLLGAYPECRVLLTTVTPTGAARVRSLFAGAVEHRYLPYDLPHAVRLFLRRINPRLLVILETEIWPNLLYYCKRRGVPAILVNARLSDASYRGYLRLRRFSSPAVRQLSHIAAQSAADAERFLALGADPAGVSVTGNLKFDIEAPQDLAGQAQSLRRSLAAERPVWIAASTHEGEEIMVLDAFLHVREAVTGCLLIIAPRHPERFDKVYDLCRRRGLDVARHSGAAGVTPRNPDVYLLDTLGDLPLFYACCDAAFVGGSLVPAGGHNMLEAAKLAVPLISGRHTANFSEIIGFFKAADAIMIVADAAELAAAVTRLLQDDELRRTRGERGQQVTQLNQGAVDSVMALLDGYLVLDY